MKYKKGDWVVVSVGSFQPRLKIDSLKKRYLGRIKHVDNVIYLIQFPELKGKLHNGYDVLDGEYDCWFVAGEYIINNGFCQGEKL